MTHREFRLENEHHYNRRGPVRWILSHLTRYPLFPLAALAAAVLNNFFYSTIQIYQRPTSRSDGRAIGRSGGSSRRAGIG